MAASRRDSARAFRHVQRHYNHLKTFGVEMTDPIDYAALEALEAASALIAKAKEQDLFADEMSRRGLALDAALSELARVRALLDEATAELREWSCSCRADRCDERGRLQPVVEARDECPRLRARAFLAKWSDWDSLRGTAPDATGDTSSEAFVREMRDEWPG